jgi:hypothetical protein
MGIFNGGTFPTSGGTVIINQDGFQTLSLVGNTLTISGSNSSVTIDADKNYVHNQIASSTTWNIAHNLNKFASVSVVDSAGSVVIGEITYVDTNNVTLTFSAAFSGKAYLN